MVCACGRYPDGFDLVSCLNVMDRADKPLTMLGLLHADHAQSLVHYSWNHRTRDLFGCAACAFARFLLVFLIFLFSSRVSCEPFSHEQVKCDNCFAAPRRD